MGSINGSFLDPRVPEKTRLQYFLFFLAGISMIIILSGPFLLLNRDLSPSFISKSIIGSVISAIVSSSLGVALLRAVIRSWKRHNFDSYKEEENE